MVEGEHMPVRSAGNSLTPYDQAARSVTTDSDLTRTSVWQEDAVALEIAWGRVRAVIDEAEATLIRTAFSPLVR